MALLVFVGCSHQPVRQQITFTGTVKAGERFERQFEGGFIFKLNPSEFGWFVTVSEKGREEDLARLTPPFHFVPNPRDIEGWHFRNEDNTGPNDGGVNAPRKKREFIFSPEVGRSIQGPTAHWSPSLEEIERVRSFGGGELIIKRFPVAQTAHIHLHSVRPDFLCQRKRAQFLPLQNHPIAHGNSISLLRLLSG